MKNTFCMKFMSKPKYMINLYKPRTPWLGDLAREILPRPYGPRQESIWELTSFVASPRRPSAKNPGGK